MPERPLSQITQDIIEARYHGLLLPPKVSEVVPHRLNTLWVDSVQARFMNVSQPPGLWEKILNNIRYIDTDSFQVGITSMHDAIAAWVADNPYCVLIPSFTRSGPMVWQALEVNPFQNRPIIQPDNFFDNHHLEELPEKGRVVLIDDASYSGYELGEVLEMTQSLQRTLGKTNISYMVALVGITPQAFRLFAEYYGVQEIHALFQIPQARFIFDSEELDFLSRVLYDNQVGAADAVLTFFEHKVPDNFMRGLQPWPIEDIDH